MSAGGPGPRAWDRLPRAPAALTGNSLSQKAERRHTVCASHPTCDDQIAAMRPLRVAWLNIAAVFLGLGLWGASRAGAAGRLGGADRAGAFEPDLAAAYWRKMARRARQPHQ